MHLDDHNKQHQLKNKNPFLKDTINFNSVKKECGILASNDLSYCTHLFSLNINKK